MKNSWWIKLSIFVVIVVGVGWGLNTLGFDLSAISPSKMKELVLSFGIWAPVMYLLAYGQPIIPLPASVMTITGGLAFGPHPTRSSSRCSSRPGSTASRC